MHMSVINYFKCSRYPYLSLITLNANGPDSRIKSYRVSEQIKNTKQDTTICCLQETYLPLRMHIDTQKMNVQGEKFHTNENQIKPGIAVFISDNIDFKSKPVTRDEKGQYIMIKGSIFQENIKFVNIYTSKNSALKIYKANRNKPEE